MNDIGAKRMIKRKAKNLQNHPTLKNVFISSDLTLQSKQVVEKKITRKEQVECEITEFSIDGYQTFVNDKPKRGAIVYVKNDLE